jgi:preprotein translocase subunit SecY
MTTSESTAQEKHILEFDQLKLRLIIGAIALLLPILTPAISSTPLSSISASYYTEAHDVFVGLLFVVGALLFAYDGRPSDVNKQEESRVRKTVRSFLRVDELREQGVISTVGAIAAIVAALCPTACDGCSSSPQSFVHGIAAVILFLTIAYFCLFVFRDSAKAKAKEKKEEVGIEGIKQMRRTKVYVSSGVGILVCILGAGVTKLTLAPENVLAVTVIFWAETIALLLFAFSWLIASRLFPYFTDPDERFRPMQRTSTDAGQEAHASA